MVKRATKSPTSGMPIECVAFIPKGQRPKVVGSNGVKRERHCYGIEVQGIDAWTEIAHGLTRSAAEVGVYCYDFAAKQADLPIGAVRIIDLGTVREYREIRGLEPVA